MKQADRAKPLSAFVIIKEETVKLVTVRKIRCHQLYLS